MYLKAAVSQSILFTLLRKNIRLFWLLRNYRSKFYPENSVNLVFCSTQLKINYSFIHFEDASAKEKKIQSRTPQTKERGPWINSETWSWQTVPEPSADVCRACSRRRRRRGTLHRPMIQCADREEESSDEYRRIITFSISTFPCDRCQGLRQKGSNNL